MATFQHHITESAIRGGPTTALREWTDQTLKLATFNGVVCPDLYAKSSTQCISNLTAHQFITPKSGQNPSLNVREMETSIHPPQVLLLRSFDSPTKIKFFGIKISNFGWMSVYETDR